jgi:hypothetical protein
MLLVLMTSNIDIQHSRLLHKIIQSLHDSHYFMMVMEIGINTGIHLMTEKDNIFSILHEKIKNRNQL